MSSAMEPQLPPADERVIRAHVEQLRSLAAEYGITELRFAGPGKLVGHVAVDKDALDIAEFDLAAMELLGGDVHLYSDGVLTKPNVSPELVTAQPL